MTTNEKVLIKVENLQKSFEDNKVLDGISTEIHQGEVVAVIGPSGSGKSTFLRSLNRLEIPTGGKIYFEGVDITAPETDIRELEWYFSSSTCFRIKPSRKISCSPR